MRARRLSLAAGLAVVLAGCASPPVLLDESDFSGVAQTFQGERVNPLGWTWCELSVGVWVRGTPPASELSFEDGSSVAATIVDRSSDQVSAAGIMGQLDASAALCVDRADADRSIETLETLDGLAEGELGWRTRDVDSWGEYVLVPLDEWRFLAVGFETDQEQPPVDMAELVTLAKEGAAHFPIDGD